jgi:hypothetical protein
MEGWRLCDAETGHRKTGHKNGLRAGHNDTLRSVSEGLATDSEVIYSLRNVLA